MSSEFPSNPPAENAANTSERHVLSPRFRILPDQPRLGSYRLCAEIATGGMATVFLADAPGGHLRVPVAIKRIHPHLAKDQTFVDMFYDEAAIASRIQHPNVCSVFDLGVHEGEYFLAMEYLMGEPLSRIMNAVHRNADKLDRMEHACIAAAVVADACRGLHAAHELTDAEGEPLSVVHRDVSPDNIFVTFDGVGKVVDFGIASASRQLHRTRTGILKGKYAYVQPEVLAGKRADRRGDVWGIGVVLWEFLTLKRLFHCESDFDTLRAVADTEIQAPSKMAAGIPEALDAIVLKALSRDPDERYASAKQVEEDLTTFLARRGVAMGPSRLSDWMSRLFPGGLARQKQFIDLALSVNDALVPSPAVLRKISTLPPPPALPDGLEALGAEPLGAEATASHEPETRVFEPAGTVTPVSSPPRELSGRTPMAIELADDGWSRRSLSALSALVAGAALAVSMVALLSPGDRSGETDPRALSNGVQSASSQALVPAAERDPAPLPETRSSTPASPSPPSSEPAAEPTAVTVKLPREIVATRRSAASAPIEIEKGTYRLELEPRGRGGWAVIVQPYEPVMEAKPRTRFQGEQRKLPALFVPTEP